MRRRLPIVGVLTAGVLAGSLFVPVIGSAAVWSALAVAIVGYVVEEAILRRPGLARWRVPLTLAGGVVALVAVVPGAVRQPVSLWHGVTSGWRRVLESTWPANPEPELVAFVPVLVLLACLAGARLLQVSRAWAVVPAVAVAGFAQAYVTVSGTGALLAGLALVGCCCLVLLRWPEDRAGRLRLVAAVAAIVVGAATLGLLPPDRAAAHLPRPRPPDAPAVLSNPLTEIAARLRSPDKVVFTVRAAHPVDRWTVITLDGFDGATWSVEPKFQRLGRELRLDSHVTVPVSRQNAEISLADWSLPWLPSQARTVSVAGVPTLLVDPASGTLLSDAAPAGYRVTWADPVIGTGRLAAAGVESELLTNSDLGQVPPGIDQLAREIGGDLRPSFQMALVLEKYLRTHYRLATGGDLPTGHGYPQLNHFLLKSKRGTSEQFAASYVVLARLMGLPARLAVGFRQPSAPASDGRYVVRNGDILAWPEVAVEGVGWVPLDPTGTTASVAGGDGLADAAATVRRNLPPTEDIERGHQAEPDAPAVRPDGERQPWPWWIVLLVAAGGLAAVALTWLAGVPLAKAIRRRRRRKHGTLGAWAEARDLLRDHGMRVPSSATARDLARAASEGPVEQAMTRLAGCLDQALWSGRGFDPDWELAWSAVGEARLGLVQGRWSRRIKLAFSVRSLF